MKGVTDRLLSIPRILAEGKLSHARNEAEGIVHLHFDVLQDLDLAEEHHNRVRRGLQLLSRDLLHDLSYDEAHALAASGAKVLHPHVLPLAAETKMTIWIRNTFKPHVRGTRIGLPQSPNASAHFGGAA